MKVRLIPIFSLAMGLALLLTGGPGRALTTAVQPQVAVTDGNLNLHLAPSGPCEVSGPIRTDTIWSLTTCDPYIVTGNISVESGATLTIEPGTTVKFNSLKVLAVAGALVARGTAESRITFTSNQPGPAPGNWGYIHFADPSTDAMFDGDGNYTGGSIIQYAVIEYAGGANVSDNGALRIEASSPFIDHNTIQDNQDDGIHIWSASAPHLTDNSITTSSGDGIHANDSDVTISRNTTARNTGYGIYVRYGFHSQSRTIVISNNTVARNTGYGIHVYYEHWNDNNVATISDNTITNNIGPGVSVYYNLWNDNNTVIVSGNTITGNSASNGGGIHIDDSYNDSTTVTISNNTITGNSASRGGGICIICGKAVISCNTIVSNTATERHGGGGIYLANYSLPTIHDNNLYGNMTGNPATAPNDLYNGNSYGGTDVNAENNYWGTTDPSVIEDHIWHFMDDPLLGYVNYGPFRLSPVPPCTPAPAIEVTISGPTMGITNTACTFTATVNPPTAAQPVTYAWQAIGQLPVTHTNGLSNTAVFTWSTPGPKTISVTATNALGTTTDTHVITISVSQCVPMAQMTVSGPTTGTAGTPYTFSAAVSPTTATQPITYAWQAAGQSPRAGVGGVNSTAIFTWCMAGPQVITATVSNACGSAKANHSIALAEPDVGRDAYEPDGTCAQARSLETDGTVQWHTFHRYADEDWVRFTVMSGTTYVIQTASTGPLVQTDLELHAACAAPPIPVTDLDLGPGTRLQWTASQTGTHYLRVTNHAPCDYGPQAGYDLSVRMASGIGAAIVVAGRNGSGTLRPNINFAANRAVQVFLNTGLSRDNLYYLNSDSHPGSGLTPDAPATSDNLQYAIKTWAADKVGPDQPLYLYLVDHGGSDVFLTNGTVSPTTAADLDGWLHNLETATGCPVNVIVEACRSGSFIDMTNVSTQTVSGAGRVVIASTSATRNAYALPTRGAYFSDSFFTALAGGADLWTAFQAGQQAVAAHHLWQMPWLDDDGDAMPHVYDPDDGREARRRGLIGIEYGSVAPYIEWVSGPAEIVDGRGTVRARVVDDIGVEFVWALVYPPSFKEPPTTDEETIQLTLDSFVLEDRDGDGEYEGSYAGFTEIGEYRIVVYAKDGDDNLALPQAVLVRTGWPVYLPLVIRAH